MRHALRIAALFLLLLMMYSPAHADVLCQTDRTKITITTSQYGDKDLFTIYRDGEQVWSARGILQKGETAKIAHLYCMTDFFTTKEAYYDEANDKVYLADRRENDFYDDPWKYMKDVDGNMDPNVDFKYTDGNWIVTYKDGSSFSVTGGDAENCPFRSLADVGLIRYCKDGKYGLYDKTGTLILPVEYDKINHVKDTNLIRFYNGDVMGIFNAESKKITAQPGKYTEVGNTTMNAKALWVANGDKWGVINLQGEEIVPADFLDPDIKVGNKAGMDRSKWCFTMTDAQGNIAVTNIDGKRIIPFGRYTGLKGYDYNVIVVKKGDKIGCTDYNGKQLVAPIYQKYEFSGNNGNLVFSNTTGSNTTFFIYTPQGTLKVSKTFVNNRANARSLATWLNSVLGGGYVEPLYND